MDNVILVTDQVFGDLDFERRQANAAGFELVLSPAKSHEAILGAAKRESVRAIYNTYYGPVDGTLMDGFKNLHGVIRCGIGVDTIDLSAAKARQLKVVNVPDYCIEEDSQYGSSYSSQINNGQPPVLGYRYACGWFPV
jgi:D-3-phosphoglycerate dehydrogenase